jgi:hypothetical protein
MIFIRPRGNQQGSDRKVGKMQRLAIFALSYGGSYKTASYVSGLGLRRVKVIAKQLRVS